MTNNNCLRGLKILVTRPEHQATPLTDAIKGHAGIPVLFPTIHIDWVTARQPAVADIYIFISNNAVQGFIRSGLSIVQGAYIFAVGKATARALADHGYKNILTPRHGFDSEALLKEETLQNVQSKRIAIIRGYGGRELLATELSKRGALPEYIEVYKRQKSPYNKEQVKKILAENIDIIIATSNEILDNTVSILQQQKDIRQLPLVVISQRMKNHAIGLGFTNILLSDGTSSDAIIQTICCR